LVTIYRETWLQKLKKRTKKIDTLRCTKKR
jgi:hypothetical protein